MALTKIPSELSSTTGIVDNSNATAITIDSNENVGIGVTSPLADLHVKSAEPQVLISDASNPSNRFLAFDVGLNADEDTHFITVDQADALAFGEKLEGDDRVIENEWMRITNAGAVGIGTSSPSTALDVVGTATMDGLVVQQPSGANILLESTTTGATTGDIFGEIEFKTNDSSSAGVKGKIDSYSEGGVGNGALRLFTGNTTGLYERMRIDSSGNVGIGTSSPSAPMHVNRSGVGEAIRFTDSSTDTGHLDVVSGGGCSLWAGGFLAFGAGGGGSYTERMRIDASGRVTMPYQPAFEATVGTAFTGDGSVAGAETFVFSNARLNVGSHYNATTGVFTAPIDGVYHFSYYLSPSSSSQDARYFRAELIVNSAVLFAPHNTISNETQNADYNCVTGGGNIFLSANDIVYIRFGSSLATNNYSFYGNMNSFSGFLIG